MRPSVQPGETYGRLTVLEKCGKDPHGRNTFLCCCTCGRTTEAAGFRLKSGHTKSCGCLVKETSSKMGKANLRHGQVGTSTYNSWAGMVQRCTNPASPDWPDYGGKGVTVDPQWLVFDNFYRDMGDRPEGRTLDRLENDKGYCKSNCAWRTSGEQARNRSNTIRLTYNGETKTLKDWSTSLNINYDTLLCRKQAGLSVEDILTKPVREKRPAL